MVNLPYDLFELESLLKVSLLLLLQITLALTDLLINQVIKSSPEQHHRMDTQLLQRIDNDKEMLFLQLAQFILHFLTMDYVLVDLLLDV